MSTDYPTEDSRRSTARPAVSSFKHHGLWNTRTLMKSRLDGQAFVLCTAGLSWLLAIVAPKTVMNDGAVSRRPVRQLHKTVLYGTQLRAQAARLSLVRLRQRGFPSLKTERQRPQNGFLSCGCVKAKRTASRVILLTSGGRPDREGNKGSIRGSV